MRQMVSVTQVRCIPKSPWLSVLETALERFP